MKDQFTEVAGGLLIRAPAKINLSLLIAGKRPDGYHEIETVMAKVDWYDELLFEPGRKDRIELVCRGPQWAPQGQENLVYKACRMLSDSVGGPRGGIKVTLTKNIPAGSGLGGPSSDAAAALIGLNRFAQMGADDDRLSQIATRLGSDVPFFLGGPLALCRGRGEKIYQIDDVFSFNAIIFLPYISLSTQDVYDKYCHEQGVYDELSRKTKRFIAEKRIDLLAQMCANMLEGSCLQLAERLADLKRRAEEVSAGRFCISGSGSAMYSILNGGDEDAKRYQSLFSDVVGCESVIVHNNRW
jgi:4-diphosphocytidyl-2-C-methyl-D-erythritol kinase